MEPTKLKQSIADAAIRCFRRSGYDEVSVQEICEEAGIVRSTFYRMFSGKKDIIAFLNENTDTNRIVRLEDLLVAPNDFERMWIIGDRYITLAKDFSPSVIAVLFSMELRGELDLLGMISSIHEWFIRLTGNCQQAGIIRNPQPAELLGPGITEMVFHQVYIWAARGGDYPLRARCRQMSELIVDLAPEYRWSEEQYRQADG